MVHFLFQIDLIVFKWINQVATHPWLDVLFREITVAHKNPYVIYGVLPLLFVFGFWRDRLRFVKVLVALALVVAVTDNFSSRAIKKTVERPRPNHVAEITGAQVRQGYPPGGFSFPSNHAANNFAGATVLAAAYPGFWPLWMGYAALTSYSRPYVGVHYPSDILFGAFLGWLVAMLLLKLGLRQWIQKLN